MAAIQHDQFNFYELRILNGSQKKWPLFYWIGSWAFAVLVLWVLLARLQFSWEEIFILTASLITSFYFNQYWHESVIRKLSQKEGSRASF